MSDYWKTQRDCVWRCIELAMEHGGPLGHHIESVYEDDLIRIGWGQELLGEEATFLEVEIKKNSNPAIMVYGYRDSKDDPFTVFDWIRWHGEMDDLKDHVLSITTETPAATGVKMVTSRGWFERHADKTSTPATKPKNWDKS